MSIHGSLAGQSWSHFHGISGTSTPSHSPRPPSPPSLRSYSCSEDVMKLPARDMHIFGICPSQDDFLLVICEICGKRIKLEAFESHNVSRHGSQRQKEARKAMLNDKASALDLIKEDIFNNAPPPPMTVNSTRGSSNSPSPSLPLPPPPTGRVLKTPVKVEEPPLPTPFPVPTKMEVVEEVSSTNNVISIPDNEPLPAGMSKDLMAMVEESAGCSLVLPPPPPPPVSNSLILPSPKTPGSNNNNPGSNSSSSSLLSTEPIKPSPSKKPRSERRQNSRDREYHPDKHCGVWDNDSKKHCTRALTCKSHSVLLKRKISGRSKSFDELVVEHKAVKEAAALAAKAASSSPMMETPSVPPAPINGVLPPRIVAPPPLPPTAVSPGPHSPPEESLFYTTDHPKPLAVCSFGARRIANTLTTNRSDVFTRKVLRLAYSSQGLSNRFNGGSEHRFRSLKQQQQQTPPSLALHSSSSQMLTQQQSYSSASPTGPSSLVGGGTNNSSGFLVNYNLSNHGSTLNHAPLVKMTPVSGTQVSMNSSTNPQRLSTGIKLSSLQQNIILQDGFKTSDFSGIQFEFGK